MTEREQFIEDNWFAYSISDWMMYYIQDMTAAGIENFDVEEAAREKAGEVFDERA